jgi:60 kDa SS-A/Ro ribonucleoprotein
MAQMNRPETPVAGFTHEGGVARPASPFTELRRSVLACMLWEDSFYESGESHADRIARLVPMCTPKNVADLAVEARTWMHLRHVPLLLACEMARTGGLHRALVGEVLEKIIQRPDEATEFLAIYWRNGRCPLAAQVKRGLARAMTKFSAYSLAKYDRPGKVRLRDVLFLTHARPRDFEQGVTWSRLVRGVLESPDTWEVALSKEGADKAAVWTRLLMEGKLGGLAFLRNLRNMTEEKNLHQPLIRDYFQRLHLFDRVMPYRLFIAARHVPHLADLLEQALFDRLKEEPKLPGRTVLLIDVSGSMDHSLSAKAESTRLDAALGVAVIAREICEEAAVFTFSDGLASVPNIRGIGLAEAIRSSQSHNGTYLGVAIDAVRQGAVYDRLIVITDEQSHDTVGLVGGKGYIINVGSFKPSVVWGNWVGITGFSERVLDFIRESEESEALPPPGRSPDRRTATTGELGRSSSDLPS